MMKIFSIQTYTHRCILIGNRKIQIFIYRTSNILRYCLFFPSVADILKTNKIPAILTQSPFERICGTVIL